MIPATSIPLGTIPTPITCPLPYINPILAATYFGTLAWYDDGFPDGSKTINDALNNLENNIGKEQIVCNTDTKNEDLYYLTNGQSIGVGNYNLQANQIFTSNYGETTPEQAVQQIKQQLKEKVIQKMLSEPQISAVLLVSEDDKRIIILASINKPEHVVDTVNDKNYSVALTDAIQNILTKEAQINKNNQPDSSKQAQREEGGAKPTANAKNSRE